MPAPENDRLRILRMLEEGKLSAHEAGRLLDALTETTRAEKPPLSAKRLRVRVSQGSEPEIDITLPLSLARVAFRLVSGFVPNREFGLELEELIRQVETGADGKVVDITIPDEAWRIAVYIE